MRELEEFLVRTPFFGGVAQETLEFLAGLLVERSFPAGATVFREGEDGKSMYERTQIRNDGKKLR
jgi:CRP-like cAMP-binding protein